MQTKKGWNSNQLKLIAIIAMTIDHLAWTLAPGYSTEWWVLLCHLAGRLTAPIMWFFIVEGWHYTHDVRKYTLRLFLLALASHFAYNFCFGIPMLPFREGSFFNQTSVAWSLAWGLVLLRIHSNEKTASWLKFALTILICVISFPSDWSCVASMAILYMGVSRGDFKKQMVWMMVWSAVYALVAASISLTGSSVRETRIVSPIPSHKSEPIPTADLMSPIRSVPASVTPRWSG